MHSKYLKICLPVHQTLPDKLKIHFLCVCVCVCYVSFSAEGSTPFRYNLGKYVLIEKVTVNEGTIKCTVVSHQFYFYSMTFSSFA